MKTAKLIQTGRAIAILSLLIGTAIFVVYYLTSTDFLLLIGYVFIVLSAITNSIFLILILIQYSKKESHKFPLFITAGIILLNIPVLLFYSWITFLLMDIMRINFINSTTETITEIKIKGCQNKNIKQLEAGQSESAWVVIKGDCEIDIEYLIKGKLEKETVVQYATTSMGHKMNYKIGKKTE
ncbi:hypothetical protein ACE193_16315 [Bernardetia sp. OM2101]|uniref:hypothetical protein n=1 Tax=Bernardetia sp. OM2101 TaxID=3344876 RepID=UPI0035CF2388